MTDLSNGCVTLDTVLIEDLGDSPVADIQYQDIDCYTPEYSIGTQVDDGSALFSWDLYGQYFSNEKEPQITESGDYTISVTSLSGCESTYSFTVESDMEAPTVSISTPEVLNCSTPTTTLDATTLDGVTYSWSGPFDFVSSEIAPMIDREGKYSLIVLDTINGCSTSAEVDVMSEGDIPIFTLEGDDLDCSHSSSVLTIVTDETYQSITWTGPDNFSNTGATDIEILSEGKYTVEVTNEFGCDRTISIEIDDLSVTPQLELISSANIEFEIGESFDIDTEIIVDEENIVSIQWIPTTYLSCSDCLDPVFLSDTTENIDYTLVIINEQGCQDEIKISFRAEGIIPPVFVYPPNIIRAEESSPNSRFTIYGSPEDMIESIKTLIIYDRWGNKLFDVKHIPINQPEYGWDGTFNGQKVEQGVYVYYSEVLLLSGEIIPVIGDVTVLK